MMDITPSFRYASALAALIGLCFVSGCSSVKRVAIDKVATALSDGGTSYASDEDPELIKQAVPFSLKLMESMLDQTPKHKGLLKACSSGFTQYAYGFVLQEADMVESKDFAAAEALRLRGKKLLIRAKNYGLRGLNCSVENFSSLLAIDPKAAVAKIGKDDVALLYWTAAAWGAAISNGKDDPTLIAEIPQMEALIDRAVELDESWGEGSIHSFLINYEMARMGVPGDASARSKQHFDRAIALCEGSLAGPYVSYAEAVCIEKRDAAGFEKLLQQALAVDPNAKPIHRLENIIMQTRARWLLSRKDELFLSTAKP